MVKRTIFATLGAAVVIFIALNITSAALERKLSYYKDYDSFVWNYKTTVLRDADPRIGKARVIILGDSQTMSGILPERLGGLESGTVYNLGLPAQQPEGLLSIAALLKDAAPELKTVIINVNPFSLFKSYVYKAFLTYYRNELLNYGPAPALRNTRIMGRGPGDAVRQIAMFMPLRRAHETLYPYFAPGQNLSKLSLREVRASMIKPRGKDRLERERKRAAGRKLLTGRVNAYMRAPWSPRERMRERAGKNEITASILRNHNGYWTWQHFEKPRADACDVNRMIPAKNAGGGRLPYPARSGALDAWRRLFRELRSRGLRVVVVQVPLSSVWEKATDPARVLGRLDADMRRAGRGLGIEFIGRPPGWNTSDPRLFHDWTHLSYCGAMRYTDWLRARIAPRPAAGRP